MSQAVLLDAEEYIEQAYFFRTLRERLAANQATQDVLDQVHEEILATTRLPLAIQFLATELKHAGLLSSGFRRLAHYFTPFQTFVVASTERENLRFAMDTACLVLEREAQFRARGVAPPGLFLYHFEVLSRNRLGYDEGLQSVAADPLFDEGWRRYIDVVRAQVGLIEFAEMLYLRSELYVADQRRTIADYVPPVAPLFGLKEGRIAKANRGRDPLYLFAALQRQLGYPEVPRPTPRDDLRTQMETLKARLRDLEKRVKLMESELAGQIDLTQLGRPELPRDDEE